MDKTTLTEDQDDTLIEFKEGVVYETTYDWGLGYVISDSDAFDYSLVDETVTSETIKEIFDMK